MNEKDTSNNPYLLTGIETCSFEEFALAIRELASRAFYPLYYFGGCHKTLYCAMAKGNEETVFLQAHFPEAGTYESFTPQIPAFHIFERELHEEFGLLPEGHPWLKPIRFPQGAQTRLEDYPFFGSDSSALHEVAVGPVHAGVIEPGHFRFICHGETIEHLEIQLGFQHRGIARLLAEGDLRHKISLAEAIAGDTAIGHGLAYCMAVEAVCGAELAPALKTVRYIALELERIAMHLADLSALAGDIAYISGQNFFAALRTTVINSSLAICGSRFGKRWLRPGGVNYGLSSLQNKTLRDTLATARLQIIRTAEAMFADSGVLNRFDSTGAISLKTAQELNMSGITAKAAGLGQDARKDFPFSSMTDFEPLTQSGGDVYSRAWLRYQEILQSLEMIDFMLHTLPEIKAEQSLEVGLPQPDALVVSIVEGWRGRIVHVLKTDSSSNTEFYRVYDPSLHNWFALALAVRNEGISDFPLCNKSFDLSYCGADL